MRYEILLNAPHLWINVKTPMRGWSVYERLTLICLIFSKVPMVEIINTTLIFTYFFQRVDLKGASWSWQIELAIVISNNVISVSTFSACILKRMKPSNYFKADQRFLSGNASITSIEIMCFRNRNRIFKVASDLYKLFISMQVLTFYICSVLLLV